MKYVFSHLIVEVVQISRNKHVNVSHDLQHIQTLYNKYYFGYLVKLLRRCRKLVVDI